MARCYRELKKLTTFNDRFDYLNLNGKVAVETFGFDRHMNQGFYHSMEWAHARDIVISRDNGCDLGVPGYEIHRELLVHHMEPISKTDIMHGEAWIIDPEYLITTTHLTHNAIHYGNLSLLPKTNVPRRPGDTKLW